MFTLQWLTVLLSIVGDNHQQALYVHHPFAPQKQSHCSCRRNRHNHSKEESQLNHQFGEHTVLYLLANSIFPTAFCAILDAKKIFFNGVQGNII